MKRIFNIAFYILVVFVVASSVASAIGQKPLFFVAIKSNSMYPRFERGDLLLVAPLRGGESCKVGDIVLFRAQAGSLEPMGWVCHRIIGGDAQRGFITQGDANEFPDQLTADDATIQPQWIGGRVLQGRWGVARIRFLGYLSIGMERLSATPFALPAFVFILGALLAISELKTKKRKKVRKVSNATIYMIAGFILSILVATSMLSTSQHVTFAYSVGDARGAASAGAGVLTPGDQVHQDLAQLSNKGFIPVLAIVTSADRQLSFSHDTIMMPQGQTQEIQVTVTARQKGDYASPIHVGLFYPILPASVIYALAAKSYWLALVVISLIPGLPILCFPLYDAQSRGRILARLRQWRSRLRSVIRLSGHM